MPNYFIGRTRTADGILSDPVNLAARGSEEQLHKVMDAAGWSLADDITPAERAGLHVKMSNDGVTLNSEGVALAIHRILQEGLANAAQ